MPLLHCACAKIWNRHTCYPGDPGDGDANENGNANDASLVSDPDSDHGAGDGAGVDVSFFPGPFHPDVYLVVHQG